MAEKSPDELVDILNSSGFLFQLGVQREIEQTRGRHGWEVEAREYPWKHAETGKSGFADLISRHQQYIFTLVIECKRVRETVEKSRRVVEAEWMFLVPEGETDQSRLSAFWTDHRGGGEPDIWGWADFDFAPASPEAAFCVFKSQDEKSPLIERVADDLLQAIEGIGVEEVRMSTDMASGFSDHKLFLPVIVTNAALYAASFDPAKVGKKSGNLDVADCAFKAVPCVRFRKGLRTVYPNEGMLADVRYSTRPLRWASASKDRSILVINSTSLADTLVPVSRS